MARTAMATMVRPATAVPAESATALASPAQAVADVVEAMVSHRPYRPALSMSEAPAEVADGAGTRYDADVCAACLSVCNGGGFKFGE